MNFDNIAIINQKLSIETKSKRKFLVTTRFNLKEDKKNKPIVTIKLFSEYGTIFTTPFKLPELNSKFKYIKRNIPMDVSKCSFDLKELETNTYYESLMSKFKEDFEEIKNTIQEFYKTKYNVDLSDAKFKIRYDRNIKCAINVYESNINIYLPKEVSTNHYIQRIKRFVKKELKQSGLKLKDIEYVYKFRYTSNIKKENSEQKKKDTTEETNNIN